MAEGASKRYAPASADWSTRPGVDGVRLLRRLMYKHVASNVAQIVTALVPAAIPKPAPMLR